MSLTNDLINEFVKITNDTTNSTEVETTVYGTVVESDGVKYVRLDGSDQLTPVTTTMDIANGDRVTVLIKNHTATITGNITSPGAKQATVVDANKRLDATNAKLGDLSADNIEIRGELEANQASVEKLEADMADIDVLVAGKIEAAVADLDVLTTDDLAAINASIYNLETTYAEFESATAENFKAVYATIDNLDVGDLTAGFVKTDELAAEVAKLGYATVEQLTATELKVTNYVDSVEINGNRITAGTLTVDRLIVRGSTESIVYELNNITGALQAKSVDTLNGEIVTPRTINADKVIAGSITTTELDVNEIFANSAVITKLVAQDAFINAISTNSIVVGASNVAASAQAIANTANGKANDALTSINKISSIKYVETTYSTTFAQLKGWAEEGKSGSWSVPSTADMRVGDTLYLRCTNTTTSRYIYIAVTVTQINNATSITATSHGFIDPAATDTAASAQSTANTASSNASTALSTANTASTNASTALSTANTANSTANTAKTAATNATNMANSAVGAANAITSNIYVSGTTKINGGVIETGTIKAASIDVDELFSKELTATKLHISGESTFQGSITGSTISSVSTEGTKVFIGDGFINTYASDGKILMTYGGNELKLYSTVNPEVLVGTISSVYSPSGYEDECLLLKSGYTSIELTNERFSVYHNGESVCDAWFTESFDVNTDLYVYGGIEVGSVSYFHKSVYINSDTTVTGATTLAGVSATGLTVSGDIYAQYMEPSELYVCGTGYLEGKLEVEGEIISTSIDAFRMVAGNYGAYWRFDGTNLYLLFTNSGDQYGQYNSLRPLTVNVNGGVTLGTAVALANNITFSAKNASGTWCNMLYMGTNNYMYFGAGASERLHVGDSTNTKRIELRSAGRIDLCPGGQNTNGYSVSLLLDGQVSVFRPTTNKATYLGNGDYRFYTAYLAAAVNVSSDKRLKANIKDLDDRYLRLADLLSTKSYSIIDDMDKRKHVGFIAQDVEAIMASVGLSEDECAFFNRNWVNRKDYTGYELSLVYEELHTIQIASLQKQVRELQNRVAIAEAQLEHYQTQQLGS